MILPVFRYRLYCPCPRDLCTSLRSTETKVYTYGTPIQNIVLGKKEPHLTYRAKKCC